jgi:hypothetical protein
MSYVFVLLIAIDVVLSCFSLEVALPLLLYARGEVTRKVTESVTI